MLGRMLIHGLVAAVLVGSAAAVYAQAKDNGYPAPDTIQTKGTAPAEVKPDNGYLRPAAARTRGRDDGRDHRLTSERRRDGHDHRRDRDDDDD